MHGSRKNFFILFKDTTMKNAGCDKIISNISKGIYGKKKLKKKQGHFDYHNAGYPFTYSKKSEHSLCRV